MGVAIRAVGACETTRERTSGRNGLGSSERFEAFRFTEDEEELTLGRALR
jgi:hypothetical protein